MTKLKLPEDTTFTKDQIFKNDKFILIELSYGVKVVLPLKEANTLISLMHQAEVVDFETYTEDITIKPHEAIRVITKAITKQAYQMAKVKALLMPFKEDQNETDK